jgi:hypothetical protein
MGDAELLEHVRAEIAIDGRPGPGLEILASRDIRDPEQLCILADLFRRDRDLSSASMIDIHAARAFRGRGDLVTASSVLRASIEADPTSIEAQVELALILKGMGQRDESALWFESASALYAQRGDPRAEALLTKALRIRSGEEDSHSGLGSAIPATTGLVDDEATLVGSEVWVDRTLVLNLFDDHTVVTPPPIECVPTAPLAAPSRIQSSKPGRKRRQLLRGSN